MNMEYLLPFLWKSKLASHCTLSSGYLTHEPEACTAAAPPLLHKRAARSLRRVSKTNTDSWTPECVSRATGLSQSWLRAEHCPGTSLCPSSCSRLPTSPGHWAMSGWRQLAAVSELMMHKPLTVTSPSLLPRHFFLSRKTLLTKITNVTFLFMAKKATHIAHQKQ